MRKFYVLSVFFMLAALAAKAQLALQPGATWLFRSNLWGISYGEKWEYMSSSGNTIHMRVTTRCAGAFPGFPPCSQSVTVNDRYFTVTNDKVMLDGMLIADFSLQAGDSTASPYSYQAGITDSTGYCDSLRTHPATVIESGTETVNGLNSRYYVIRFVGGVMDDDNGQPVIQWGARKFSEYAWIVNGYWWFADQWIICDNIIIDPYIYRGLVCYYDDQFAAPAVCELTWFDWMDVNETDISDRISVYPNPATDILNIRLTDLQFPTTYKVLSADGKIVSGGSLLNNRLDVGAWPSGMYFLLLQNDGQTGRVAFVKQ